jgi:hypothetical protein
VNQLADETSKFGKIFEGFHLSGKQGKLWVLGLRNIITKGATDTMTTFKEILSDISDASQFSDRESSKSILLNIVSTMSQHKSNSMSYWKTTGQTF